jgi:quercetin dioxygenase-like cupin family protein
VSGPVPGIQTNWKEAKMIKPHSPVDTGHGIVRTVLAETPAMMLVEFAFAEGAEGRTHQHPHVQSTFVKAGRYRFTVGEETFEVGPGDAFVIPSDVPHGCQILEGPGVLLDTFAPRRDDFL